MGTLVELTVDECLELLGSRGVGRVAVCTPQGPRIVPVNYSVYDDAIVFRTTPYSEVGSSASRNDVAFEIDHIDEENHLGWSVVVFGTVGPVTDPDEVADIRRTAEPGPWAEGLRNLFLKITWHDVTGRRMV